MKDIENEIEKLISAAKTNFKLLLNRHNQCHNFKRASIQSNVHKYVINIVYLLGTNNIYAYLT